MKKVHKIATLLITVIYVASITPTFLDTRFADNLLNNKQKKARLCLHIGANPNISLLLNKTKKITEYPLSYCIEKEYFALALLLVKRGANINTYSLINKRSPFIHALIQTKRIKEEKNQILCNQLLEMLIAHKDFDMECKTAKYGLTPLMASVQLGSIPITQLLLTKKLNINATNKFGLSIFQQMPLILTELYKEEGEQEIIFKKLSLINTEQRFVKQCTLLVNKGVGTLKKSSQKHFQGWLYSYVTCRQLLLNKLKGEKK